MEENILTADQVAQKLQVHPFTVLKFIKQGKLKASKLGRVYRIRESDVMIFLDEQQTGSSSRAKAPAKKTSPKDISPDSHLVGESKEEALSEHQVSALSEKSLSPSLKPSMSGSEKSPAGGTVVPEKQSIQTTKQEEKFDLDHYILD